MAKAKEFETDMKAHISALPKKDRFFSILAQKLSLFYKRVDLIIVAYASRRNALGFYKNRNDRYTINKI